MTEAETDAPVHPVVLQLVQRRIALGWSQNRLAEEIDMTASQVWRIENGQRSPTLLTLDRLARPLGMRIEAVPTERQAP